MAPQAGDKAPAFTLPDQDGEKVKLTDLKGRKVLVYFYPKADTPGAWLSLKSYGYGITLLTQGGSALVLAKVGESTPPKPAETPSP